MEYHSNTASKRWTKQCVVLIWLNLYKKSNLRKNLLFKSYLGYLGLKKGSKPSHIHGWRVEKKNVWLFGTFTCRKWII